jgi:hypothetical protein
VAFGACVVCAAAVAGKLAGAGGVETYPRLHFALGPGEGLLVAVLLGAAAMPLAGRRARLGVTHG